MMTKAITLLLALAGFLPLAQAQDAQAGQAKASMCMGCHGIPRYQASFPQVYKVPKISGQGAQYIVAALTEYKKGERHHPTMQAIAGSLSDKDMADLAAYFSTDVPASMKKVVAETPPAAPAEVGALIARGACTSCHGVNFDKPIAPTYPKLAGQHADYLFAALRAYASPDHALFGRNNAIMGAQVKQFKESELKAIATYIGSLPGDIHTVPESRFR